MKVSTWSRFSRLAIGQERIVFLLEPGKEDRSGPHNRASSDAPITPGAKASPAGRQLFGGASAAPLAFRTVKIVILDEVDKLRALPGEGDADSLASKRVSTYGTDFKILRFSKPTVEGTSRINRHFLRGSKAFYHIACPSCGEFQELGWALLRFDDLCLRKEPGPGFVHLPCGVNGEVAGGWDIEAVAELTAESAVFRAASRESSSHNTHRENPVSQLHP